MSGPAPPVLLLELLGMYVAVAPLGHGLTRALERARLLPVRPTMLERCVLALFLGGAALYVLAYVPPGLYSSGGIAALLLLGAVATAVDLWRHRDLVRARLLPVASELAAPIAIALAFLTGYLWLRAPVDFANTFDGSVQADFMSVLLRTGHAAGNLAPFAPGIGVIYPQGTSSWLALPTVLYGWPIPASPVWTVPLFLAAGIVAAAAWVERLGQGDQGRARLWAAAGAGFFAVLATWPRLLIFGSYDFALGLPLLFVLTSWSRFQVTEGRPGRGFIGIGLVLAVGASLSVAVAEFAGVLIVLGALWPRRGVRPLPRLARAAGAIAIGLLGVLPSLLGMARWWGYPSHVRTVLGAGGPYIPVGPGASGLGTVLADLDPFVPLGPKLAPGPILWAVLAALLVGGLLLCLTQGRPALRLSPPLGLGGYLVAAVQLAAVGALWTGLLLVPWSGPLAAVGALSSLPETSLLFFVGLELVALAPILWLIDLARMPGAPPPPPSATRPGRPLPSGAAWAAVALVVVIYGAGAGGSIVELPGYVATLDHSLANVTAADQAALRWAGSHLTERDRVLVAPGSAAQYLVAYAPVPLLYPMNPPPADRQYWSTIQALQAGTLNASVLGGLAGLQVSVVFVTGASTVLYPPIDPAPLLADPAQFPVLFHSGDAYLFGFDAGAAR